MTDIKENTKSKSEKNTDGVSGFFVPLAIVLSAILVSVSIIYSGSNGAKVDTTTEEGSALGESDNQTDNTTAETPSEPGTRLREFETFTEYDTELCEQDGKPIVYLFSTTWCPHCEWIKETFDNWAKDNSDKIVAHHWELDTNDDSLTEEVETEVPADQLDVFNTFNPEGSVPTFVFGCKYRRIGNGYESDNDLNKEKETFDKLLQEMV